MANVYAAIGSNISPEKHIKECLLLLRQEFTIFVQSSYFITSPYGFLDQGNFINLVVGFSTRLPPIALLQRFQEIEKQFKRERKIKDGPRTIDLDILLYDSVIIDEPNLKIPHPGLLERDFFLVPMIEVAPQLIFPVTGEKLSHLSLRICYRHIIHKIEKGKGDDARFMDFPLRASPRKGLPDV